MNIIGIVTFIFIIFIIYLMYMIQKKEICLYENAIKILYRQCARWAAASIQDEATIIKMLHANYAAGYLWAIKDIVSCKEFQKINYSSGYQNSAANLIKFTYFLNELCFVPVDIRLNLDD